jgi:hypothetical protein
MIARALRFLALSLALLPVACGSSGETTNVSPLTCQAGQFRLRGMLGAQPVDLTASSAGGGLTQLDTGELFIGENPDPAAPVRPQLHLTWAHGLVDGASGPASGTLVPADGPFAGQTLCVGAGTEVSIYKGAGGVGLVLDGFASGANCDTPVDGTLAGCWN